MRNGGCGFCVAMGLRVVRGMGVAGLSLHWDCAFSLASGLRMFNNSRNLKVCKKDRWDGWVFRNAQCRCDAEPPPEIANV